MSISMKLGCLCGLVLALALQPAFADGKVLTPQPSRLIVSIGKFDNKVGLSAGHVEQLEARIRQRVVGTRKFDVFDREQIKQALREQVLAAAGVTKAGDSGAPDLTKMKAASYLIYGSIGDAGVDMATRAVGDMVVRQWTARLEIALKVTEVSTGRILIAKSVKGTQSVASVAGSGGNDESRAMRAAIDEVSHGVATVLRDLFCPAKIIASTESSVTIDMNDEEVKPGDLFDVIEVGKDIVDPDTGDPLGCEETFVGRIRVDHAGAQISQCKGAEYYDEDEEKMVKPDLSEIDLDEGQYLVRRVSKDQLKKEADLKKKHEKARFEQCF